MIGNMYAFWDLALAWLYDPKWKTFVLNLPIPFTQRMKLI